jgi:hypothetical protein
MKGRGYSVLRYYPRNCLQYVRKATEDLSKKLVSSLDPEFKPEYKVGAPKITL